MGRRSMADFSMEFWTLVEETGWKEKVLRGAFLNGLNERITRELAIGLVFSKSRAQSLPPHCPMTAVLIYSLAHLCPPAVCTVFLSLSARP